NPGDRRPGVIAELAGRQRRRGRRRRSIELRAEADAERLLKPDRGGERERAAPRKRLLKGGNADLCLGRQAFPRYPAARQFLADMIRDLTTLHIGQVVV